MTALFHGLVIGLGIGIGTLVEAALLYLVLFQESSPEAPWLSFRGLRVVGIVHLVLGAIAVSVVLAALCGMALVSLGRSLSP